MAHEAAPNNIPAETHAPELIVSAEPASPPAAPPAALAGKDTMDVYGRRLRGTSALATRVTTMGSVPATVLSTLEGSSGFGPQTWAIGGTTLFVTGAVLSTLTYAGQRVSEKKRAGSKERSQAAIRAELNEPVNRIRNKGRGKKQTLRWYGADAQYGGDQDPYIIDRLVKVVDYADERQFTDILMTARLLPKSDSEQPGQEIAAPDFSKKLTTTEQFFLQAKGSRITDRYADPSLVRLTVQEARQLVEHLKTHHRMTKTEALTKLLLMQSPNHPMAELHRAWQKLEKPEELKSQMRETLRRQLERHFSLTATPESAKPLGGVDEAGRRQVSMDMHITVSSRGVQKSSTTRNDNTYNDAFAPIMPSSVDSHGFDRYTEGKSMSAFIDDLLKPRTAQSPKVDGWKLEMALYHMLNQPEDTSSVICISPAQTRPPNGQTMPPTLYERMTKERPKTALPRPWMVKRGTVKKSEQTIEYRRPLLRSVGKKVAALAIAVTAGYGVGQAGSEAWDTSSLWTMTCETLRIAPLTTAEQADCDQTKPGTLLRMVSGAAEGIHDLNNEWENTVIEHAYTSGLLTPETIEGLSGSVSKEWLARKMEDFQKRVNLYGERSSVGDVQLPTDGDPVLWSLNPIKGASTKGYWPTSVQNHLLITDNALGGDIPPFTKAGLEFRSGRGVSLIPEGAPAQSDFEGNSFTRIRELDIPDSVPHDGKQLIEVNGRLLLSAGESFHYAPERRLWRSFPLPVQHGADIVAANILVKDLSNDKVVAQPDIRVYQQDDGTFHVMFLLDSHKQTERYMSINYTIDPHAASDWPVRAVEPIKVGRQFSSDKYFQPLSSLLSVDDVSMVNRTLGLPPNASVQDTVNAIQKKQVYSFTPYADEGIKGELQDPDSPPVPTDELLARVADYAAQLRAANCNASGTEGIIATRGVDGNGFLNGVVGFSNNDGDNTLTQTNSHFFTTNNEGVFYDFTPTKLPENFVPPPPPAPFRGEVGSGSDSIELIGQIVVGLTGFGLAVPVGAKYFRRRRQQGLSRWIDQPEDTLGLDISLINHLLFMPSGSTVTETPASKKIILDADTVKRSIQSLPVLTPKHLDELVRRRQSEGTVDLSPSTLKRMRRTAKKIQAVRDQGL